MSKCAHLRARSFGPHLLEVGGAGQRREDRETGLECSWCRSTNDHRPLEIHVLPRRIDDEVSGDPVVRSARATSTPRAVSVDGRVLRQTGRARRRSPLRGRRRCRSRWRSAATPRAVPDAGRRDRRGSARASTACGCRAAAAPARARGCATDDARRDRRRRTRDRRPTQNPGTPTRSIARGPRARAAARSSRTSSGTDSPRAVSTELRRPVREAGVLAPPRFDVMPRRQRHRVEVELFCVAGRLQELAVGAAQRQPGTVVSGAPRSSASHTSGSVRSPSSSTTAVASATRNGSGYAAAVWPPTMIGTSGASALTRRATSITSSVSERVHRGDADEPGRDARSCAATELVKRRSARVT